MEAWDKAAASHATHALAYVDAVPSDAALRRVEMHKVRPHLHSREVRTTQGHAAHACWHNSSKLKLRSPRTKPTARPRLQRLAQLMERVHDTRRRLGQLEDAKAALHEAKAVRMARLAATLDSHLRAADAALTPHR